MVPGPAPRRARRPSAPERRPRPRSVEGHRSRTGDRAEGALAEDGVRSRFRELDAYRTEREWRRLEGTPQRDLFRELRARFLDRNLGEGTRAADIGSGPGRFAPHIGTPRTRRLLLDLSLGMLLEARRRWPPGGASGRPDFVVGDAAHLPLRAGSHDAVALLGNVVGFSGSRAEVTVDEAVRILAPGGRIVVEIAPSSGERSRYLARLPPGAVRRLLAAPINAVRPRLEREGFRADGPDAASATFARMPVERLLERFAAGGVEVGETMAVAPALGPDADRIAVVRADPPAWRRLLELEEAIGRAPARWARAAAVLVAGRRSTVGRPND